MMKFCIIGFIWDHMCIKEFLGAFEQGSSSSVHLDFFCGLAEKFEQVRATMPTEPQRRVGKRSQHAKSSKNLVLELSSYMLSLVESIGQCLFCRNLTLMSEQVRAHSCSPTCTDFLIIC